MSSNNKIGALELFLLRISGCNEEARDGDHNYSKVWNSHANCERTKPAKMLFMNAVVRPKSVHTYPDEEIDVLSESPPDTASPFDNQQSKLTANDLENSLKCYFNEDMDKSELYDFQTENLPPDRRKYYKQVMELINDDILAKTTYAGQQHEFIKKSLITERCARQLRSMIANTFFDWDDLIIWLHKLILDKGDLATVSSYLSMLQAITAKAPNIVNVIVRKYSGRFGSQFLWELLRKESNPTSLLYQKAPKKIPGDPYMIFNCAGFNYASSFQSARLRFMIHNFSAMCKTTFLPNVPDGKLTYEEFARESLICTKARLMEIKNRFPNRPIIIGGWTTGALIACYIALEVEVDAVVCFGFPLTGINGSSGNLNDPLLELKAPTLFVIGQNSNKCSIDDIEDFRCRMTAESGLIIVGGANDSLCVSTTKLMEESITQDIVDRCIMDEVGDFLHTCLAKLPTDNSVEQDVSPEVDCKRKRGRPKEYSPKLPASRKRVKLSVPKEIPIARTKSRLSPSSSGCCKNVKQTSTKAAKKFPEKRRGRPPNTTSRNKTPPSPAIKPSETAKTLPGTPKTLLKPETATTLLKPSATGKTLLKPSESANRFKPSESAETFKPVSPAPIILSPPKRRAPITGKKNTPSFALSILAKNNDPVDVEKAFGKASKVTTSFALNILTKNNDPIDVKKAFGKDSSFLPRPLTPPEPEDTISAEETEKAIAELEGNSVAPSTSSKVHTTDPRSSSHIISNNEKTLVPLSSKVHTTDPCSSSHIISNKEKTLVPLSSKVHTTDPCSSSHNISNKEKTFVPLSSKVHTTDPCSSSHNISNKEKTFVPVSKQPSVAILGSKAISGSIIKRTLNSTSDPKKGIPPTATSGFKTVFQPRKMIPPGSGSAKQMKNMPVRLILNPPNTSKALTLNPPNTSKALTLNPPNTSKATFTVPPNTMLLSSQKTPGGKVQLLLQKGQMPLKTKDQLTSKPASSINNINESSEQQSCNLSLLSDVAGMTEPLVDSSKKLTGTQRATLIKLAVPDKMHSLNRNPVLKSIHAARSAKARIDTPEERAEKRLAVQALNESVGIASPTPSVREPSYSICYARPDGSVVSRVVSKPGPATYIRPPIITQPPGKIRPILEHQVYDFNTYKR